ncbi:hypothetical protein [Holdemania filiformis]|uniref:Uncharacterized protein n=1 Tax=Holdemania filiformis TaxID=61171 RepID=A0A412FY90_9FIRM|nr:hypothetical protein [Holdemania filiformis]MBS5002992.1 hypothetical protein [Holdemania filiformis]RGR73127.1 hypothetical protein DWY25_11250 [Holdemania filiformis]
MKMIMALVPLAEEVGGATIPDLTPFITAMTGALTPEALLAVLATIIGVGMGFVLMWFGVRKSKQMFQSAVFKGRLSV